VTEVQALLGSRFGGAWIVPSGSGEIVHVGVVDPDAPALDTVSTAASRYGLSGSVSVDPVRYSTQELEGFYAQIQELVATLPSLDGVLGFGVRSELNKVELILSSDQAALVEQITAAVPADALTVTTTPGGGFTAA
jgi:hypothetical protein